MVNVSASCPITTPLNFNLEPFGIDWMLEVRAGACVVETCPETSGVTAKSAARTQTRVKGRPFLIPLVLILAPSNGFRGMRGHSAIINRVGVSYLWGRRKRA